MLPEALLNYLARLGWSHGDEEVFPKQKFVEWFDLAHVPLILGADKKRLSKRHGATSVTEYRNQGYLPAAMVNFLPFSDGLRAATAS